MRFTLDEWMLRLYELRHDDPAYAERIQGCQDPIWEMARQVLAVGHPVILDWNHWSRDRRAASRERAEGAGYPCILHWLDVPLETAVAQARARSAADAPHAHDIDEDGVRFFATIFQPPEADEGVVVDHIRVRDPLRDR